MNQLTHIDLLTLGKTGNGKSALGNTILKRKVFLSKSSCTSVTTAVKYEVSDYKGKIIKVVDAPGVGDTRIDTSDALSFVIDKMTEAVTVNPRGYHAFLIVVRYGGRFTLEDQDVIASLKKVFGKNFVREFCILVMTYGDNFEREFPLKTFKQWCTEQDGVFQDLLRECEGRIVLFDNVTQDEAKRDAQIDKLLSMVNSLQAQGIRYTDKNFKRAEAARAKAIVESKVPVIQEETIQETSLILQNLEEVSQNFESKDQIPALKHLLTRCDELIKHIQEQDKGTGALHNIMDSAVAAHKAVNEAIRLQTFAAEERTRMEAREKELKAQMERERENQRRLFEAQEKKSEEARKSMEKLFERTLQNMQETAKKEREAAERELKNQLKEQEKAFTEQLNKSEEYYERAKKSSPRRCTIL